jgi:hypothetical protein
MLIIIHHNLKKKQDNWTIFCNQQVNFITKVMATIHRILLYKL